MTPTISVLLPTHNPHPGRLARTLASLQVQTFPVAAWELILIDNASDRLPTEVMTGLPPGRIVHESRVGLTYARLAGAEAARGETLVFVDDDNELAPDYLAEVAAAFDRYPRLGAAGGRSVPQWEIAPPPWIGEFANTLAVRDLGDRDVFADASTVGYPPCSPIGAGMAVRKAAFAEYASAATAGQKIVADRTGSSLSSGGDCDIIFHVLRAGWQVAYLPVLTLTHLIPAGRLTCKYLGRLNRGIARSWVGVLAKHNACPWPAIPRWTLPLRRWRAYVRHRAWSGPAAYIRWQGACGRFEGQADLDRKVAA